MSIPTTELARAKVISSVLSDVTLDYFMKLKNGGVPIEIAERLTRDMQGKTIEVLLKPDPAEQSRVAFAQLGAVAEKLIANLQGRRTETKA